jgi:putative ABC transport system permease protein
VAVASLGIAAMLISSAQASRHEIATMRAVGMTRGQLAAMFAGEAAFAVACSIILSLVAGILIGWSFTSITAARMGDGLPRVLHIPWVRVAEGMLFMISTTFVMAIIPLRRIVTSREAV